MFPLNKGEKNFIPIFHKLSQTENFDVTINDQYFL